MKNKKHLGHTARKRFGQNFLHDSHVINNIIAAIAPQVDQTLVEIGPGLGALTEPMAEKINQLTVIEIDRDLAHRLRHHPFLHQKLTVIEQDVMQVDFTALSQEKKGKLRIFGNLPYNISTPLMFHLFHYADVITDMHFMLQKEVVERLAAAPNSKTYGRLSVMTQYYCQVIPILDVHPDAFKPAPKVESAVVRLIPHQTLPYVAQSTAWLNRVCSAAFGQRRKTLRNALNPLLSVAQIKALDINENARAETLSVADFVKLANFLANNPPQ